MQSAHQKTRTTKKARTSARVEKRSMESLSLFKRDVLISIKPEYVTKILAGRKTVELRRKFPREKVIGSNIFIYSTSPDKILVARAEIADVKFLSANQIWAEFKNEIGIRKCDLKAYLGAQDAGYAIILDRVERLDCPIPLSQLREDFGIRPPQSFCYIDEIGSTLLHHGHLQGTDRHKRIYRA